MTIENISEIQTFCLSNAASPEDYLKQLNHLRNEGYRIKEILFNTRAVERREKYGLVYKAERQLELVNQEKILFTVSKREEKLYLLTKGQRAFILSIGDYQLNNQAVDTHQFSVRVVPGNKKWFFKMLGGWAYSTSYHLESWFRNDLSIDSSFSYTCRVMQTRPIDSETARNKIVADLVSDPILKFQGVKPEEVSDFLPNINPVQVPDPQN